MERFTVTYRICADNETQAKQRAENIALEQTVEIPRDIVPSGYIEDVILGQVENISFEQDGQYLATISYSPDSTADELPQLLNVIFGNSSMQKGIKVIDLALGPEMEKRFTGARYGIAGMRQLTNKTNGGLIAAVIKPQGSNSETLAEIAHQCALAGADIIKDDHGLTNQHMAPFEKRCDKVTQAVQKANRETGGNTLYFPNIAGHSKDLMPYAKFAQEAGAGGILFMPGLFGFDFINRLTRIPEFNLPIMSHPTFLGPYVLSETCGFSYGMMFGTLQRLAGADISIFPNVGGRFGFSETECLSIVDACRNTKGPGCPIMPSPGGGMSKERAKDMKNMYNDDVVYLLGGSLLRYKDRIGEGIKDMRKALYGYSRNEW
ncbi:MAG: RuBisCO large subunit C-terminal-like domain-containing protein [Pseudomonadota bacterium]